MSAVANLDPTVLDTILGRLALLFLSGANGDMAAAKHAAAQMLACHRPETEYELRLAANIVSLGMHLLEALSQAATPDMPMNKILRLRGGAVSLSREADRAERRLEQVQKARREGVQPQPATTRHTEAQPPESEPIETTPIEPWQPRIDKAVALIETTRQQIHTTGKTNAPVWSKSHQQQQRQAAQRITEKLRKNQAAHLAATSAKADEIQPSSPV